MANGRQTRDDAPASGPRRNPSARLIVVSAVVLAAAIASIFVAMRIARGPRPGASPGGSGNGVAALSPFHFVDVTADTGITFRHFDGSSGKHYLIEAYASGLCVFDYDNDGDEDIYFLNGAPLAGAKMDPPPRNALYRNDGGWKFTDVTGQAGVGDTGFGLGVCSGDYDNDGDLDFYVTNFGPNVLYRNSGDGTFTDVTAQAGVGYDGCGAGCAFLDIEGDGDLDLYVANYLQFSFEKSRPDMHGKVPFYEPPEMYKPMADVLYRNNGDGTFTDISRDSGIASKASWGMGVIAADYDADGDTDIYVANDVAENYLWRNDGAGKFEEVGVQAGTAFDCHGNEQGSMGVDCADLNNDGLIDFYQTTYSTQFPATYQNMGGGLYSDVTFAVNSGDNSLSKVRWGCNFGDFDNDGDADIFVAVGHVQDLVDQIKSNEHYKEKNLLYENDGRGRFREVSASSGPGLQVVESSRGSAVADLDNDGDLDVVILNARATPTILRNDSNLHEDREAKGHWIQILTKGTKSNRAGIGARVYLTAGGATRVAEVHAGRSYQSHYGLRLHFGLGRSSRVERIEVRWPSKMIDILTDVPADQLLNITEGSHTAR